MKPIDAMQFSLNHCHNIEIEISSFIFFRCGLVKQDYSNPCSRFDDCCTLKDWSICPLNNGVDKSNK
jgi:hypothetical protein